MRCVLPVPTNRQQLNTTASPSLRFADAQLLGAQRQVLGRVERRLSHQQPTVRPPARALGTYNTSRLQRSTFRYGCGGGGRILTNFLQTVGCRLPANLSAFLCIDRYIGYTAPLLIKSIYAKMQIATTFNNAFTPKLIAERLMAR